jgi:hypothetical protein
MKISPTISAYLADQLSRIEDNGAAMSRPIPMLKTGESIERARRLRSRSWAEGATRDSFRGWQLRWSIALLLLIGTATCQMRAQAVPAFKTPSKIALFGTYTTLKPDYKFYGDLAVYGFTAGGYLQTHHLVGIEVRGSINRWGGEEHAEAVLGGPRVALHIGRFSPYISALGGGTNAWRWSNWPSQGEPHLKEGLGPQWSAVGGVDFHVGHRVSIRLPEFSYGKAYLKDWTLTPLTASAGIVYRIN